MKNPGLSTLPGRCRGEGGRMSAGLGRGGRGYGGKVDGGWLIGSLRTRQSQSPFLLAKTVYQKKKWRQAGFFEGSSTCSLLLKTSGFFHGISRFFTNPDFSIRMDFCGRR